jgi:hypothetical protein
MTDITFKSIATVIDYAELASDIEHGEKGENRAFYWGNRDSEDPALAALAQCARWYACAKGCRGIGLIDWAQKYEERAEGALNEAKVAGGFEY